MTLPSNPWHLALALAEQAVGLSDPNPRVGCVIVSADGTRLLGQGHTQAAGGPHAEVMALRDPWQTRRGHSCIGSSWRENLFWTRNGTSFWQVPVNIGLIDRLFNPAVHGAKTSVA